MMRRLITLILTIVAYCGVAEAQSLRLQERLPDVDVDSTEGSKLKSITKEYTCLVFMHSKSQPSIETIREFMEASADRLEYMAVVLITPEDDMDQEQLNSIMATDAVVAFDNNNHTFESFEVHHVPFAVIYQTSSRIVKWFGALSQLDGSVLHGII